MDFLFRIVFSLGRPLIQRVECERGKCSLLGEGTQSEGSKESL